MSQISEGRITIALAAVLAIWLFGVLPFLYGPPPRFAETGNPPQPHSEQAEHQPTARPDGSATAPFFIRIPKTAKEETEEASDRREKSSTDRWLMIFTGAVALFTLLLVGATVMLYFAGEKQLRLATDMGRRQSDEMQASIAVAKEAADAANKSAKLSFEVERARLHIHELDFTFDENDIPDVKFKIKNFGRTPAIMIISRTRMEKVWRPPAAEALLQLRDFDEGPFIPRPYRGEILNPHESIEGESTVKVRGKPLPERGVWIFRGKIIYYDIFGNKHEKAFALNTKGLIEPLHDSLRGPNDGQHNYDRQLEPGPERMNWPT
jgi:hypothetical protein